LCRGAALGKLRRDRVLNGCERVLAQIRACNTLSGRLYAEQACRLTCCPAEENSMCRNIRTLFNFEPPATEDEIHASALQFVRKLSGFTQPSKVNEAAFNRAVEEVSDVARRLLASLATVSPPRNREVEAMKAKARARERYG